MAAVADHTIADHGVLHKRQTRGGWGGGRGGGGQCKGNMHSGLYPAFLCAAAMHSFHVVGTQNTALCVLSVHSGCSLHLALQAIVDVCNIKKASLHAVRVFVVEPI